MASSSRLTDDELGEVRSQSAGAVDLARFAALDLSGEVADIRRAQAATEAARLRFKYGADAAAADLPEKSGAIRDERGREAKRMGKTTRDALDALLDARRKPDDGGDGGDGRNPGGGRTDPGGGVIVRPPGDGADRSFTIKGRVVAGARGVAGLTVEAVATAGPTRTTVASATTDRDGGYVLSVPDVAVIREKLGLDARAEIGVAVSARKETAVVARAPGLVAVRDGGSVELVLEAR